MTTPEMIRCKKCSNLIIDETSDTWMCQEEEQDIHDIPNEDCPLECDW